MVEGDKKPAPAKKGAAPAKKGAVPELGKKGAAPAKKGAAPAKANDGMLPAWGNRWPPIPAPIVTPSSTKVPSTPCKPGGPLGPCNGDSQSLLANEFRSTKLRF